MGGRKYFKHCGRNLKIVFKEYLWKTLTMRPVSPTPTQLQVAAFWGALFFIKHPISNTFLISCDELWTNTRAACKIPVCLSLLWQSVYFFCCISPIRDKEALKSASIPVLFGAKSCPGSVCCFHLKKRVVVVIILFLRFVKSKFGAASACLSWTCHALLWLGMGALGTRTSCVKSSCIFFVLDLAFKGFFWL